MPKSRFYWLIDVGILLIVMLILLGITWGKWTHPINDFGREAYIPWRLNKGEKLYADLPYLFGALPPLWNALMFKLFGVSLQTLFIVNSIIVFLQTLLLYRLVNSISRRSTAVVATAGFLTFFVFNYQYPTSNMYYLSPYSHSYFYAIFFCLMAFNVLEIYLQCYRRVWLLVLGIVLGAVLLSRFEIFFMLIIPIIVIFALLQMKNKDASTNIWPVFFLGILISVVPFILYLATYMPMSQASFAAIGYNPQWVEVGKLYLYKNLAGIIHFNWNLKLFIGALLAYVLFAISCLAWSSGVYSHRQLGHRFNLFVLLIFFVASYGAWVYFLLTQGKYEIFRASLIIVIWMAAAALGRLRTCGAGNDFKKTLIMATFSLFAIFMLMKVPLSFKLSNYALIYGMPAAIVFIIFWLDIFPQYIQRRYHTGVLIRRILIILVASINFHFIAISLKGLEQLDIIVSEGRNSFNALGSTIPFGTGNEVNYFLDWSRMNIKADERFIVLPQGVMLNFLSGNTIGGKHVTFMPAEIATYGESKMLDSLRENPPDYVVLLHMNYVVYGNINPGVNYAVEIYDWVKAQYHLVWLSGSDRGNRFGMRVFKRNTKA